MKKSIILLLALLLPGTMLTAANTGNPADPTAEAPKASVPTTEAPAPAPPATKKAATFFEVRNAALSKERLNSIKSTRIIFEVNGDHESAYIMLRAVKYDKIRLDCINGSEHFCVARNGETSWYHDKKDGTCALSADEEDSFSEYIAFLEVPFSQKQVFSDPVFKGEEEVNKVKRSGYEVSTLNESGNVYRMWLEEKSKLLRKVEQKDANGKLSITMYRDFRNYNGVKLPRITCTSGVPGSYTLKIIKVDWNLDIDEKIFEKSSRVIDPELKQLMESSLSTEAREANAKKKRAQYKNEQLEKKIRRLKIEIAANEKELQRLESISQSSRSSSTGLASVSSHSNNRYWGWGYSGQSRDRAANRDSLTRRKVIYNREKEIQQVSSDYNRVNRKLVQQRIELGDAEAELKKLSGAEE